MNFHNGAVYCDRCGKPIRLVIGVYISLKNEYCADCAKQIPPPPTRPLIVRLFRRVIWFLKP